jgi:hypothetical protein
MVSDKKYLVGVTQCGFTFEEMCSHVPREKVVIVPWHNTLPRNVRPDTSLITLFDLLLYYLIIYIVAWRLKAK